MKKWLSGLLALLLTATLLPGCAQQNKPKEPPSGVYYDVTGIDPKSAACTIDGVEFPAEMYLYWLTYVCQSLEANISMYASFYGMYTELIDEDGNLLWGADFEDGQTLAQYAKGEAENMLRFYATVENMAKESGVELTDDDRAALEAEFADMVESMGGEEELQWNLDQMGVTRETLDRISANNRLADKLVELVMQEGSPLYMPLESYEEIASYADHILLSNTNMETNEALTEEEIAEKHALAEDLLNQLKSTDDKEALFDQLAGEYSEDPGRAAEKGYVVTAETNFVQEFLDAALSLEPGQVSEIVESSYGYHILYRRELAPMLANSEEQLSVLASSHLSDLLRERVEASSMELSEQIAALDVGTFYNDYAVKADEMAAAREAENNPDAAAGANDTNDTNDTDSTEGTDSTETGGTDTADGVGEPGGEG